MDTKIKINVYTPGYSIKEVRVDKRTQIRILHIIFPGLNIKILHKGVILSESFTFEMYNINDGDLLVAAQNLAVENKWKRLTSLPNIINTMNVNTCKEMVRVSDLKKSIIENKPRKFRQMFMKMQRNWDAEEERRYQNSKKYETIIGEPPKSPCCEEIKISWSSSGQHIQQETSPNVLLQDDKILGTENLGSEKVI